MMERALNAVMAYEETSTAEQPRAGTSHMVMLKELQRL